MRVTYLAHDLDDPSVWRRVDMLRRGGAQVTLAGFRRGTGDLPEPATVLGQTANGRMIQRVRAILAALPRIARQVPGPDAAGQGGDAGSSGAGSSGAGTPEVVLARNLEMLALGATLLRRRRRARQGQDGGGRLVYELLDIHGMMLGRGMVAKILRRIEAALLRSTRLIVLSSPAFETRYLRGCGQPGLPTLLVENKPFARAGSTGGTADTKGGAIAGAAPGGIESGGIETGGIETGGPLIIGWFGMLRCRWSLQMLDALTRARPGRFRVVMRGRPALDVMPDFHQLIAANPDLDFLGPYSWPDDLPGIYAGVDVAWLIDRYQAGQNSDWLLPNRLYEGCLNGAVPVALQGTEVARRVQSWDCGVIVGEPDLPAVEAALTALDATGLARRRAATAAIPRDRLEMDDAECRRLTAAICGRPAPAVPAPAAPLAAPPATPPVRTEPVPATMVAG